MAYKSVPFRTMSKVDARRVSVDGEQVPTPATGKYGLIAIIETRDTAQVPLPGVFFPATVVAL
jgi:hypothetical protein